VKRDREQEQLNIFLYYIFQTIMSNRSYSLKRMLMSAGSIWHQWIASTNSTCTHIYKHQFLILICCRRNGVACQAFLPISSLKKIKKNLLCRANAAELRANAEEERADAIRNGLDSWLHTAEGRVEDVAQVVSVCLSSLAHEQHKLSPPSPHPSPPPGPTFPPSFPPTHTTPLAVGGGPKSSSHVLGKHRRDEHELHEVSAARERGGGGLQEEQRGGEGVSGGSQMQRLLCEEWGSERGGGGIHLSSHRVPNMLNAGASLANDEEVRMGGWGSRSGGGRGGEGAAADEDEPMEGRGGGGESGERGHRGESEARESLLSCRPPFQTASVGFEVEGGGGQAIRICTIDPKGSLARSHCPVRVGWHLKRVDGVDIRETHTVADVASMLKGPNGRRVTLRFEKRKSKKKTSGMLDGMALKEVPVTPLNKEGAGGEEPKKLSTVRFRRAGIKEEVGGSESSGGRSEKKEQRPGVLDAHELELVLAHELELVIGTHEFLDESSAQQRGEVEEARRGKVEERERKIKLVEPQLMPLPHTLAHCVAAHCVAKEKVLERDNKQLKEELNPSKAQANEQAARQDKYGGACVDPVELENVRTQLAAATTQLAAASIALAEAGKARDAAVKEAALERSHFKTVEEGSKLLINKIKALTAQLQEAKAAAEAAAATAAAASVAAGGGQAQMTEEAIKQTETYQKLLQISRSNNEKATQDKSKYKAQILGLQGEVKARTEAEASALKAAEAATAASAAAGAAHTNDMSSCIFCSRSCRLSCRAYSLSCL
jgi:hypothetical protein